MKRFWFSLFVFTVAAPLFAEVALVYKSDDDVKKTVFMTGVATTEGIVVSAQGVVAAGDKLSAGLQGQELKKAALVRFDNDLNLALIRLGDRVSDEALQAAHKKNSEKMSLFVPELGQVPVIDGKAATAAAVPSNAPKFVIKLNDVQAGGEPVVLEMNHKKANLLLQVVGQNIEPLWRVTVDMEAEPRLAFWKKGEQRGLNAIPSRTLHYSQQVLLRPYGNGDVIKIPIEISSIKQESYDLKIKIDSKAGPFEISVPVRFVDK